MFEITLTDDQQAAYQAMVNLMTTDQKVLVITGFAGTGKTTLVSTFIKEWSELCSLSGGAFKQVPIYLTATTNKAADALYHSTKIETSTIHSLLGLRVINIGYKQTDLVDSGKEVPTDCLIIIDEASFIDQQLLEAVMAKTKRCKIVFLGDPAQLKPVGSDNTPVFDAGYTTVKLEQIVRQSDDSPIQKLSRSLRDFVTGKPIPNAGVNGVEILHMNQADFEKSLIADCKTHAGNQVRALAWTNKKAIYYNGIVANALTGDSEIRVGDTAVVNKQVALRGRYKFTTDSTVTVKEVTPWVINEHNIVAREVTTDTDIVLRQAFNHADVEALIKTAYDQGNIEFAYILENTYVDLRLMYASTVNKSQGSTYDTVYVDLNDIGACRDQDQVRRMLYVAVSRARNKVVFTGDI